MTERDSIHRAGQDSPWQQSGISYDHMITFLLVPLSDPTDPVLHQLSLLSWIFVKYECFTTKHFPA